MLKKIVCKHCQRPFTVKYRKGCIRRFCTPCIRRKRKKQVQDWSRRREEQRPKVLGERPRANSSMMRSAELSSRADVAAALGLSVTEVHRTETAALAKLQKNTELKELWRRCLAEGLPPHENWCDEILDYQLEMARFYEVHAKLVGASRHEAALECLSEIRRCQRVLDAALGIGNEI